MLKTELSSANLEAIDQYPCLHLCRLSLKESTTQQVITALRIFPFVISNRAKAEFGEEALQHVAKKETAGANVMVQKTNPPPCSTSITYGRWF